MHRITLEDLRLPWRPTPSATGRPWSLVPRGPLPKTLPGYAVSEYVAASTIPRLIRTAPNGDVFVAESNPGRVRVVRGRGPDGRAQTVSRHSRHGPGPARSGSPSIRPGRTRSGSTSATPTRSSASLTRTAISKARGAAETIVKGMPAGGQLPRRRPLDPRHRVLARRQEAVRSASARSPTSTIPTTTPRRRTAPTILEFNPDGKAGGIYATGVRNAVGLAFHPEDRQALGLGQRARRSRRQPRARLHHARGGRRLLRLAVVLHRRHTRIRVTRASIRS